MKFRKNNRENYYGYQSEDYSSPSSIGRKFLMFLVGVGIFFIGIYLIFQNTTLSTSFAFPSIMGYQPPFGIIILPLILGIGVLFFNDSSILGWLLVIFGVISILVGILMGLRIYFRPVSLYEGVLMYGMTAAGIGLIAKSFVGRKN